MDELYTIMRNFLELETEIKAIKELVLALSEVYTEDEFSKEFYMLLVIEKLLQGIENDMHINILCMDEYILQRK